MILTCSKLMKLEWIVLYFMNSPDYPYQVIISCVSKDRNCSGEVLTFSFAILSTDAINSG